MALVRGGRQLNVDQGLGIDPIAKFDPNDSGFSKDPYAVYAHLRKVDPIHWEPKGFWVITRYADVRSALGDHRFSNRPAPFALVHIRNRERLIAADVANRLIAFMDAPEHTALRAPISKAFRESLKANLPAFGKLTDELLAKMPKGETVDFVKIFAEPFAALSVCQMFGFPEKDAGRLLAWSDDFFTLFHAIPDQAALEKLEGSLGEFRDYVREQVEKVNAYSGPDVTKFVAAEIGKRLSMIEAVDNLMLLVADGIGNVQAALATCVSVLQDLPEFPATILATPEGASQLVDECLRMESPGQFQGRITLEPVEIGGKTIPANSIVLLCYGSANRDPEAFENPDEFNPDRKGLPHLAFGGGRHMCLGHSLVRNQLSAVLPRLLGQGKRLKIVTSDRDWQHRFGHRWLNTLPVQLES